MLKNLMVFGLEKLYFSFNHKTGESLYRKTNTQWAKKRLKSIGWFVIELQLGICTDPRHIELFGVRFGIPAFEPVRTVRTVRIVRIVRTIRTSCLRLLRSTYHGSHRLTRDACFLYVWPDFLNTSLTRYFKWRD